MTESQLRTISNELLKQARALANNRKIGSCEAQFHSEGVGVTILLALSSAFHEASIKGALSDVDDPS